MVDFKFQNGNREKAWCPILATMTNGTIYNFVPDFNNGSSILSLFGMKG